MGVCSYLSVNIVKIQVIDEMHVTRFFLSTNWLYRGRGWGAADFLAKRRRIDTRERE
jgi:hypothetical protein